MPGKVNVTVTEGPRKDNRFTFEGHDTFLVGRTGDCHLRLPERDPTVSRRHCVMEVNSPAIRIRDLGSRNGTIVNNVRYGGRVDAKLPPKVKQGDDVAVDLKDGDVVRTGHTVFQIRVEAEGRKPVRCLSCRKKATEQPGTGPGGDYLCGTCLRPYESDPLRVILGPSFDSNGPRELPGYEIVQTVARGPHGTVYLARREADGEVVALKVLLSRIAVSNDQRRDFQKELEPLLNITHESVVPLTDHGGSSIGFYFVTEYCAGGSARDLMKQQGGPLAVADAGALIVQTLAGLDAIHKQGLVHGDIKPSNLLLVEAPAGPAKLADAGTARLFERFGFTGMTITADTDGDRCFMSRERLTNFRTVDPAGDLWSMGATLYHLVTGEMPRELPGDSPSVERHLRTGVTPIQKRNVEIPESLASVIHQALATEPEGRFATAAEFRTALESALQS